MDLRTSSSTRIHSQIVNITLYIDFNYVYKHLNRVYSFKYGTLRARKGIVSRRLIFYFVYLYLQAPMQLIILLIFVDIILTFVANYFLFRFRTLTQSYYRYAALILLFRNKIEPDVRLIKEFNFSTSPSASALRPSHSQSSPPPPPRPPNPITGAVTFNQLMCAVCCVMCDV